MRSALALALVLVLALFLATVAVAPADARPFDLVHADRADITLPQNLGVMLGAVGFGVLVNTGPVPITVAEMEASEWHAVSSVPGFSLDPLLFNYITLGDLAPGHARGTALPIYESLLLPGELFEPVDGQYLIFMVYRGPGTTYEGPVNFHVTGALAGSWAEFDLLAQMHLGPANVVFTHATRLSAVDPPVAAHKSTWGAIKSLYR